MTEVSRRQITGANEMKTKFIVWLFSFANHAKRGGEK
jgi:hypothetical protein